MTGILKVDQWKDSGDNALMTSDGAGNLTANVSIAGFSSTGIDDNATSTAITIDSSEQVGIGVTNPQRKLQITGASGGNGEVLIATNGAFSGTDTATLGLRVYQNANENHNAQCEVEAVGSGDYSASLTFKTAPGGSDNNVAIERMRIQSNGDIRLVSSVGIGSYTTNPGNWVSNNTDGGQDFRVGTLVTSADASVIHIINKTTTGSGNMMAFRVQGSTKGTISTDGSSTSYNTSSDYRLKENVVDVVDATARLKQLQPKRFNFIEQPNKTVDGFLAHEVSDIVPEAITGTKDEIETYTDIEGNEQTRPVYQNIDQSKLVPLLTASLKEAIAKIEELETRLAALENA